MRNNIVSLLLCIAVGVRGKTKSWRIASKGIQTAIIDLGVAGDHTQVAFAASLENGVGSQVIRTDDLGLSWNVSLHGEEFMMLGATCSSPLTAVVAGALGEVVFTVDGGSKWTKSAAIVGGTQNIETSRDKKIYGATAGKGVHVSKDLGLTFKYYKVPRNETSPPLFRYGAFPSDTTWYLSAGTFPAPAPSLAPANYRRDITSRISIIKDTQGVRHEMHLTDGEAPQERRRLQGADTYAAQIWKTTDAGNTWKKQLDSKGDFYMNGINCCSETVCYAVGEGFSDDGSKNPGARIFKTEDGNAWKQVLDITEGGTHSLIQTRCVGNGDEAWAAGGNMVRPGFEGEFWYTDSGGRNWTKAYTNTDAAILAMEFDGVGDQGMASGLTPAGGGVIYSYKNWLL